MNQPKPIKETYLQDLFELHRLESQWNYKVIGKEEPYTSFQFSLLPIDSKIKSTLVECFKGNLK